MRTTFTFTFASILAILSLSACSSDDDNNTQSATTQQLTMAEAKAAIATSENTFYGLFNQSDFTAADSLVKYFNKTYIGYTSDRREGVKPLVNVLSALMKIKNGDISAFPALLTRITQVAGTYRADTANKQWKTEWYEEPDSTGKQKNDWLIVYFTDEKGQECAADMHWEYSKYADSLIVSDADQTVKVVMPQILVMNLFQNGQELFGARATFDYDSTSKTLSGITNITMKGNYFGSAYINLTNNSFEGTATVTRNGSKLISASLVADGNNFIDHVISNSVPRSVTYARITINMANRVGLNLAISDVYNWNNALKKYRNKTSFTSDEKSDIVALFNKYISRNITLDDTKSAGQLTFIERPTPTNTRPVGQLDTKVNFANGESCMLYDLFTHNERRNFLSFVNNLFTQVAGLTSQVN